MNNKTYTDKKYTMTLEFTSKVNNIGVHNYFHAG